MKRVLKQNGSIYLQMDTRINHWMRILMDKVLDIRILKTKYLGVTHQEAEQRENMQVNTILYCFIQ